MQFSTALLIAVTALCLSGCSAALRATNERLKVFDESGLLSTKTKADIASQLSFPSDVVVIIRTTASIPSGKEASIASAAMEEETYWKQARTKNLIERLTGDSSDSTAVYVYISKQPRLIQIRYGNRIGLQATRSGIASGQNYLAIQQAYWQGLIDANQASIRAMSMVASAIKNNFGLPWYLENALFATGAVELAKPILYPQDGFYQRHIFQPVSALVLKTASHISHFIAIPLAGAGIYLATRIIVIFLVFGLVMNLFFPKYSIRRRALYSALLIIPIALAIGIPAIGTSLLASTGRLEDKLALENLGLSLPPILSLPPLYFAENTGLFLAASIAAVKLLKSTLSSLDYVMLATLPAERQQMIYEKM